MHQLALSWRVLINGLFQRIQHEACIGGAAGAPTNNQPCINIVDERHIHKALPCRDIGELADLEHVWRWRKELAVHHCPMGTAAPYLGSLSLASCRAQHFRSQWPSPSRLVRSSCRPAALCHFIPSAQHARALLVNTCSLS